MIRVKHLAISLASIFKLKIAGISNRYFAGMFQITFNLLYFSRERVLFCILTQLQNHTELEETLDYGVSVGVWSLALNATNQTCIAMWSRPSMMIHHCTSFFNRTFCSLHESASYTHCNGTKSSLKPATSTGLAHLCMLLSRQCLANDNRFATTSCWLPVYTKTG